MGRRKNNTDRLVKLPQDGTVHWDHLGPNCLRVGRHTPVLIRANHKLWRMRIVRAGVVLLIYHNRLLQECHDHANFDLATNLEYYHKSIFGIRDHVSVPQFKVSLLRSVPMSCSLTLSYPTFLVFPSSIVMARFSAKASSMDAFPRRSARQRRTGSTRSTSTLSHHRSFAKAKPTQMATPRRSCLSFIYVGNVSVHPAANFFMP